MRRSWVYRVVGLISLIYSLVWAIMVASPTVAAGVLAKGDIAMDDDGQVAPETGDELSSVPLWVLLPQEGSTGDYSWNYILEILGHVNVPFKKLKDTALIPRGATLVLIPGNFPLSDEARSRIEKFVSDGGTVIGIGGSSGMDALFGVRTSGPAEEGYIKIASGDRTGEYAALTDGFESSLHWWRGSLVVSQEGISLAKMLNKEHRPTDYDAIVVNRYGRGLSILYAPDLVYSILHIQQGINIQKDGVPAPDGSAPVNDGILKTDDGMVLDWEWDRTDVEGARFFAYPIGDELRELILKGVFYAFSRSGMSLPMVWYWKDGLDAVGLISHDSDGNDPVRARMLHNNLLDLGIKSTWCIQYPGGYSEAFYRELESTGYEVALHYDAMTGGFRTTWGQGNFKVQHDWLLEVARLKSIISNKNHYLRWQGYLDFFRWLEEAGIQADQSKGPSKRGNVGFIFGGSHPWFPMDERDGSFIDVLEINLATQDLVLTCPYVVGPTVVDQALKHNGIAHFLFHPAHVDKPGIADAMKNVVNYGREKGIEWWTSRQINAWERARRAITIYGVAKTRDGFRFKVDAPWSIDGVTIVALLPDTFLTGPVILTVNGEVVTSRIRDYLGFKFIQFIAPAGGTLEVFVSRKA